MRYEAGEYAKQALATLVIAIGMMMIMVYTLFAALFTWRKPVEVFDKTMRDLFET